VGPRELKKCALGVSRFCKGLCNTSTEGKNEAFDRNTGLNRLRTVRGSFIKTDIHFYSRFEPEAGDGQLGANLDDLLGR
jgi:hypothetical protein